LERLFLRVEAGAESEQISDCPDCGFQHIPDKRGLLRRSKFYGYVGSLRRIIRLLMPVLAVELKEIVQSSIRESPVDFGAVQRNIAIGKFHTDMFPGIVVIVKFHVNSGTGKTATEFIP
jgi:hypothetical protein